MTAPTFNPFPGLRPFEDADARFFFGRDEQVDQLLKRLQREQRFVGVVGQSGCGKSSLVRAGLLPVLYAGFMARAGSSWRVALMRPSDAGGDKPIESLAQALEKSGALENVADEKALRVGQTIATLLGGARGLVEVVQQSRLAPDENVLIVVDQFEELFRFRHSVGAGYVSDDAAAFVKLLLEASKYRDPETNAPLPVYVLITMRSDFIGDCAQFRNLPETLNDGLFLVPRLTRDQLREAIEGPVGIARASIAARLVNRLLNEPALGDNPDELPVLQHSLMRMWDIWAARKRPDLPLDVEDYEATGGLERALSIHGDEVLTSLPGDRLRIVTERIFKALTQRGSDNRGVRRPSKVEDLVAAADATAEEVKEVVNAFRARDVSFLMPPAQRALDEATVVDLTHEALMRNWERLAGWVDEEAEAAKEYQSIRDAAEEHARGREALLVDPRLSTAEDWRDRNHPTPAWAKRYGGEIAAVLAYIEESRRAADAEAERRQEAHRREARARLVPLMAAITLVAIVASIFAIGFASVAAQQRSLAVSALDAAVAAQNRALVAQNRAVAARRLAERRRIAAESAERNERAALKKLQIAESRLTVALNRAQVAEAAANAARAQLAVYAQRQADMNRSLALAGIDHALYSNGGNRGSDRLASGDNRIAGLIGADAYAVSPTGDAKAVLLSAAVTSGALGRVALPPWDLGAVTGRGRYVVVLTGAMQRRYAQPVTGSLVSVDALTLAVLARVPHVRATLLCGFDSDSRVAIATGSRIQSYRVGSDGGLSASNSLRTGDVRALACTGGDRVVYVDGSNTLRIANLSGGRSTRIGHLSGNANGITLAPSAQLAAVTTSDGSVDIFDLRSRRLVRSGKLFTDPSQDCIAAAGCAGAVAFNFDTRRHVWDIAWYDAGNVHVEPVTSSVDEEYACPVTACAHAALTFEAGATVPDIVGGNTGVTYYDESAKRYAASYNDYAGSQRHPLFDSEFHMYVTPYDPAAAAQQNPFGSGIAAESFLLEQGPLLGVVLAQQWSSPGLVGHEMLMATTSGLMRFDLDHLRASFNQAFSPSYRVQIRDSGDGAHGVTFDWKSGVVRVLDIRSWPATVLHRFRVAPVGVNERTHLYTYEVQVAYDPHSQVVTMLSYTPRNVVLRVARYSADGRLLHAVNGTALMAHARARVGSIVGMQLTDRGNYVVMKLLEPAPDVIVRSDGARVGSAYSIDGVSNDETTAIADDRSTDHIETIYRLPQWSIEGLNPGLPASAEYVSMSPDGQTIAYATYDSSASRYYLHLYDVPSRITYNVTLPLPPDLASFRGITFSSDSRYLLVTYNDTSKPNADHVLAIYTMDPHAWMRAACLMAGRPLTAAEFHAIVGPQVPYQNGCAPYAGEMYRW